VDKILRWSLLVFVFLIPLFSPERLHFLNTVFPVLILFIGLCFACLRLFGKRPLFSWSKPVLYLLFLSSVALLSTILSGTAAFNLFNIKILFLSVFFIVAAHSFTSAKDREKAAYVIVAGAMLAALFAFYQRIFGLQDLAGYLALNTDLIKDQRIAVEIQKSIDSGRVFSFFVNANVFAGFLAMALPVSLGLFLVNYKNIKLRAGTGLCFLTLLTALVLTKSAGGFVSAVIGLIIYLFYIVKEKNRLILVSFSLTAVFVLAILLMRPEFLNFAKEDNSIINRLAYFKESSVVFLKNPLLGSGIGSYGELAGTGVKYPHNWYLQTLTENGVLGFGLLILFLAGILKEGIVVLKKLGGSEKYIFAGIFAGFISFLVHNMFDVDSNYWQNSIIAFFFAGVTTSCARVELKKYFPVLLMTAMGSAILFARQENVSLFLFAILSAILFLMVIYNREKFIKTALDIPLMCFLLLALLSCVFSVNRFASFQSIFLLLGCFMLFYSTANSIKKDGDTNFVFYFISWLCLGLALSGIAGYYYSGAQRSFGLFTNPNLLGGFLASGFGFLLFQIVKARGRDRVLFIIASAASLFCLVLTKSRGGLLVAVCSICLFIILINILAGKKAVSGRYRRNLTLGLLALLAVSLTPLNPIMKRAMTLGVTDEAAYSRTKIWGSAIKLYREKPFTGFGLNTYKDVVPKYYFPVGGSIGNFTRVQHHAHNEYLQFLAETGIAGGVLILVFLFVIIRQFLFIIRKTLDKEKLLIAASVFTALCGLLVHALVDFNLHFLPTLLLLVLLTGVLFSEYLSEKNYRVFKDNKMLSFNSSLTLVAVIFLGLAGMNFFSVYFFEQKPATSLILERNLKLSTFLNPANAGSFAELGKLYRYNYRTTKDPKFIGLAEESFKEAQKKNPANAHYHKHLALLYYIAGIKKEVFPEYIKAVKLYPYDVFLKFELAYLYAESADYNLALQYVREAVRLEPNFVGAHLLLSGIYSKLKNPKAAVYERNLAFEINARYKDAAVIDYEKMLVSTGERR